MAVETCSMLRTIRNNNFLPDKFMKNRYVGRDWDGRLKIPATDGMPTLTPKQQEIRNLLKISLK